MANIHESLKSLEKVVIRPLIKTIKEDLQRRWEILTGPMPVTQVEADVCHHYGYPLRPDFLPPGEEGDAEYSQPLGEEEHVIFTGEQHQDQTSS